MTGVAIVTGAGRGIGRAIAEKLAQTGHPVALCSRSEKELEEVAASIRKAGGKALPVRTDVSSEDQLKALVQAAATLGTIEILVNNAGIAPKPRQGKRTPLMEMTVAEWNEVIDVNLTSAFILTREAGKIMGDAKRGAIVNIASIAIRNGGLTAGAHYVASKSGMIGLTKASARELAPYGIRVNAIAPGRISTAMTVISNKLLDSSWTQREVPLGREGRPEEIADAVLFLASDRASFITGMTLDVTGGWSMP
jgi:3-oxoacyl-[acyl-carrier protein] reductase